MEVWMGWLTNIPVIIDTASDWLVLQGEDCENCCGKRYSALDASEDGNAVLILDEYEIERQYGTAILRGQTYQDTVCLLLSDDFCMDSFEFFLVNW